MKSAIKWGVILAIAVTVLNLVSLVAGFHRNPLLGLVFIAVAVLVNIGVIAMALKETASASGYLGQLGNGAIVGLVGGVLIFAGSWLLLAVVFPDSIEEMKAGQATFIESAPLPEEQKQQQLAALDQQGAVSQAMSGLIGTALTSLVVGAVAGIFLRKK